MKSLIEFIKTSAINEMADKKSQFEMKLFNMIDQILENWCLVKWCDDNPTNNISIRLRNRWATELKTCMKKIANVNLKSGRKDKVIKNVLVNQLDLDDNTNISKRIRKKFNEEGLAKYINTISYECASRIREICSELAGTEQNIEEYVKGELG